MSLLDSTKSISANYKSTRTCFDCGCTGVKRNGYIPYPCSLCKGEAMPVKIDIDRLIYFIKEEIERNKSILQDISIDNELSIYEDMKLEIEGQKQAYENLLGIIFSNSLS